MQMKVNREATIVAVRGRLFFGRRYFLESRLPGFLPQKDGLK